MQQGFEIRLLLQFYSFKVFFKKKKQLIMKYELSINVSYSVSLDHKIVNIILVN